MRYYRWILYGISIVLYVMSFLILGDINIFLLSGSWLSSLILYYLLWNLNRDNEAILICFILFLNIVFGLASEALLLIILINSFYLLYDKVYNVFQVKYDGLIRKKDDNYFSFVMILKIIVLSFSYLIGKIMGLPFYYFGIFSIYFTSFYSLVKRLFSQVCIWKLYHEGIIVFNEEKYLELMKSKQVIFTKTGVLTTGDLVVSQINCKNEEKLWYYLNYAEALVDSRISKVIREEHFREVDLSKRKKHIIYPNGISYTVDRKKILVGNNSFMTEHGIELGYEVWSGTVLYVAVQNKYFGCVVLSDKVNMNNKQEIIKIGKCDVSHMAVFSHDQELSTVSISRMLGIKNSFGELNFKRKDFWLYHLKRLYGNFVVLISDNPSCLEADVKIGMNNLYSEEIENSDIMILDNSLSKCTIIFESTYYLKKLINSYMLIRMLIAFCLSVIGIIWINELWIIYIIYMILLISISALFIYKLNKK